MQCFAQTKGDRIGKTGIKPPVFSLIAGHLLWQPKCTYDLRNIFFSIALGITRITQVGDRP